MTPEERQIRIQLGALLASVEVAARGSGVDVGVHLSAAISSHQRRRRLEGQGVPAGLLLLGRLSAAIATGSESSGVVTGGHTASILAVDGGSVDGVDMPADALLDRQQTARRIRCSVSTVDRRIRIGALPVVRHGRVIRIRVADADAFVNGDR